MEDLKVFPKGLLMEVQKKVFSWKTPRSLLIEDQYVSS